MSETNETPKEAGWPWACRHSVTVNGITGTAWCVIGRVFDAHDIEGRPTLKFVGGAVSISQDSFDQFDWHKIELPEGWR